MSRRQARDHVFRAAPTFRGEEQILDEVIVAGSRVLDVGTGATGRSARLCRARGARVVSFDVNASSVAEFAASGESADIALAVADVTALPFAAGTFDLVLVAYHGIDYLVEPNAYRQALTEIGRVLAPGGHVVLNSWNRLATTTSPTGLKSAAGWRLRLRHVLRGGPLRATLVDGNGLELRQAFAGRVIRDVEQGAGVTLRYMINASGSTRRRWLLTLSALAPYYVFRRSAAG